MSKPIYLDYNATTPVDPIVVEAMEPYLRELFGNPSSDHAYGYHTRLAVQTAREQLAALLFEARHRVATFAIAGLKDSARRRYLLAFST